MEHFGSGILGRGGKQIERVGCIYGLYIHDISDADLNQSSISMRVMEKELTILSLISGIAIHSSIRVSIHLYHRITCCGARKGKEEGGCMGIVVSTIYSGDWVYQPKSLQPRASPRSGIYQNG